MRLTPAFPKWAFGIPQIHQGPDVPDAYLGCPRAHEEKWRPAGKAQYVQRQLGVISAYSRHPEKKLRM